MRHSRGHRPTKAEIQTVARATVTALAEHGLECCLFGSAASSLYGASRVPNDVDVIVLNLQESWDVEDVKQLLEGHENFFLVPSTNPRNTYQVLWYSLLSKKSSRACKVDILAPGTLEIPQIPISRTVTIVDQIPLVPFVVLLLLKLKGWEDHCNHHRQDMINKQHVDVQDIDELLGMIAEGDRLRNERWLPKGFVRRSRNRVRQYVNYFSYSADGWRMIGFNV